MELRSFNLETGRLSPKEKKKKEEKVKLEGSDVNLFDFLNDITYGKKRILNETETGLCIGI